jgi:hypothetical protein
VDRAAQYLSGGERLSGARLVDSLVQLRAPAATAGTSVELIDPDGRRPLSLSEARTAQTFRLTRTGFYQIRFANGRDAVLGVNPDRRESDLEPLPKDVEQLWSGSSSGNASSTVSPAANEAKYHPFSLWWYVMLLVLVAAIAESVIASSYMGTEREET